MAIFTHRATPAFRLLLINNTTIATQRFICAKASGLLIEKKEVAINQKQPRRKRVKKELSPKNRLARGRSEKNRSYPPKNRLARGKSKKNRSYPPKTDWHVAEVKKQELSLENRLARGSNQFGFAGPALHQLPNSQPSKNHNELLVKY